jgi:hypothetical protein
MDESITLHVQQCLGSILVRLRDPNRRHMWAWTTMTKLVSLPAPVADGVIDPETLAPLPEDDESRQLFESLLLLSQMRPCFYIERDGISRYYATLADMQAFAQCPVFLVSLIKREDDIASIDLPHAVPPPEHGTGALILPSLVSYTITDLPAPAQHLQRQISQRLTELAEQFASKCPEQIPVVHLAFPEEVQTMIQQLAREYYAHHQKVTTKTLDITCRAGIQDAPDQPPKPPLTPLPALTTRHQTLIPSVEHLRGLVQSFGLRTQGLWNSENSIEQLMMTPNGAHLAVRGENSDEQRALHQFITGGMGAEGIKYMAALLAIYYELTGAPDRKTDARIKLRQILQYMGRGDHADDPDEQRKLLHYILYMARTWITALDKIYDQSHRRGRPRKGYREYSPLIVLEALGGDARGGLLIPDVVEFHLGKEYWDQMFGQYQHFFTMPTRLILNYHSKDQAHEIYLAFYLANMINLSFGTFEVHFPILLIQTAMQDQQGIERGTHRTRDALRVLYALERLEIDLLITRAPHPDIDQALAVEYYNGKAVKIVNGKPVSLLSEATCARIENAYRHFQALTPAERQTKQRKALQDLLERITYNTIKFTAGPLINTQIQKRRQQRQQAIETREAAQGAARERGRKRQKS